MIDAATLARFNTGPQIRQIAHAPAIRAAAQAAEAAAMEIDGIAVPFDTETELFEGLFESIAPGAIIPRDHRPLFWRHRDPIGKITATADTGTAFTYSARISDIALGRDAYTLAKDEVVTTGSIGFVSISHEETIDEAGNIHIRHTAIDVREISLEPIAAYETAAVLAVRGAPEPNPAQPNPEGTPMPNTDAPEAILEIRAALAEHTRTLETLRENGRPADAPNPFAEIRSFGEYVKMIARGDEIATRAFTGAVSGDTIARVGWVGDVIRLVEDRYRLTNLFRHTNDLPAEGMTIEFGVLETDTIDVAAQAAEGDPLAYGKVTVGTLNAAVKTYGGWTDLSRQAIERSSVNHLDLSWRALALRYGSAIETATRTLVSGALATALAGADTPTDNKIVLRSAGAAVALAASDADDWRGVVLDLFDLFDSRGLTLDGLVFGRSVVDALAAIPEAKKALEFVGAPTDKAGTLEVRDLGGTLYSIPWTYLPNSPTTAAGYNRDAVAVQEAPGAPFRLQDESVVNLTKSFSLYGYAAHALQIPGGLIAIDTDGTA